jgi:Fibronectin type III domain
LIKSRLLNWAAGAALVLGALLAGCNDPGAGTASPNSAPAASNSGSVTLSWEAPTSNTNGSALTDLSGYRIYYGVSPTDLSQTVEITSVGIQTYVLDDLPSGTWYFAVIALSSAGNESGLSNIVVKTIT